MTFCENQIEFSQLPIAILGGFLGGKKFGFHIHHIQSNKHKHICGKYKYYHYLCVLVYVHNPRCLKRHGKTTMTMVYFIYNFYFILRQPVACDLIKNDLLGLYICEYLFEVN